MTIQDRHQFVATTIEVYARPLIGVFAQTATVAVTENVGIKHLAVVARRLEEQHIGVAELMLVAIHADLHA